MQAAVDARIQQENSAVKDIAMIGITLLMFSFLKVHSTGHKIWSISKLLSHMLCWPRRNQVPAKLFLFYLLAEIVKMFFHTFISFVCVIIAMLFTYCFNLKNSAIKKYIIFIGGIGTL